jgi:hypothetical protein
VGGWLSRTRVTLAAFAVILTVSLFGVVRYQSASLQRSEALRDDVIIGSHRRSATEHAPDRDVAADDAPAQGVQDLYGNEVSDAVTTFKIDGGGSLYEVHSPQTGLLHLGPPTG